MKREELIEKIVAINYHAFESAILAGGMSETKVAKDILDLCQPQWVSVEDRLPKEGGAVIAYNKRLGVDLGYYFESDKKITTGLYDERASYWMPLPSPPIESKEEL